jgi:hypothetical protein
VTVGAPPIVSADASVAAVVSGLVTVTERAPVAAPAAIVNVAVIWVALATFTEETVTPVPETLTVAPVSKLVPVRVTVRVPPTSSVLGDCAVRVGAAPTVSEPLDVALVPSVLVTVTDRVPMAAPAVTVNVAVICVELVTLTDETVTPVPEALTVAPLSNPVPVSVTVREPP